MYDRVAVCPCPKQLLTRLWLRQLPVASGCRSGGQGPLAQNAILYALSVARPWGLAGREEVEVRGGRLWFPALWMLSSCLYAGIQSLPSAYRRSSGQMKRARWWLTDLSPKTPSPTRTTPCLFTLSRSLFSIFRPGPGLGSAPRCWLPYSQTRNVTYHFAFLHPPV